MVRARSRTCATRSPRQADPRERDRKRLASPKLTLRRKHRVRAAQQRATASASRSGSRRSELPTGQLYFAEHRAFLTGVEKAASSPYLLPVQAVVDALRAPSRLADIRMKAFVIASLLLFPGVAALAY